MILWLFLISFVSLINAVPLVASTINEANHPTIMTEAKMHAESGVLVEKICNLFRFGHSIDEVVAIFVEQKEYSYELEKTIKYVYEILHKQNFKDTPITIVTDSKQSEEYYSQKNFNIKVKRVAIIVTIIIAGYLLFKFHNLLAEKFNLFGDSSYASSDKTDTSKGNNSEPSAKEFQKPIDPKNQQNNVYYNQRTTTEGLQQSNKTTGNKSTGFIPSDILKTARFRYRTRINPKLLKKCREAAQAIREEYAALEKEK